MRMNDSVEEVSVSGLATGVEAAYKDEKAVNAERLKELTDAVMNQSPGVHFSNHLKDTNACSALGITPAQTMFGSVINEQKKTTSSVRTFMEEKGLIAQPDGRSEPCELH